MAERRTAVRRRVIVERSMPPDMSTPLTPEEQKTLELLFAQEKTIERQLALGERKLTNVIAYAAQENVVAGTLEEQVASLKGQMSAVAWDAFSSSLESMDLRSASSISESSECMRAIFSPVLFMGGMVGRFFLQFGIFDFAAGNFFQRGFFRL